MNSKELYAAAKRGDFKTLLNRNYNNLSECDAVNVLIYCCKFCASLTEIEGIDAGELFTVIEIIGAQFSKPLDEKYFKGYLGSINFILPFLIKKGCKWILRLEPYILPEFAPEFLSTQHEELYISIYHRIEQSINRANFGDDYDFEDAVVSHGLLLNKIIARILKPDQLSNVLNYWLRHFRKFVHIQKKKHLSIYITICHLLQDLLLLQCCDFKICYGFVLSNFRIFLERKQLEESRQCIDYSLKLFPLKENWLTEIINLCKNICMSSVETKNIRNCHQNIHNLIEGDLENSSHQLLSEFFISFSLYCKYLYPINNDFYEEFYQLGYTIIHYLSLSSILCEGECICFKRNIAHANNLRVEMLTLFSTLSVINETIVHTILDQEKLYSDFLYTLTIKKCQNQDIWLSTGANLFNMSLTLYKKKYYEMSVETSEIILRYQSKFKGSATNLIVKTMSLISSCYLHQKQYLKALMFCALELLNSDVESKNTVIKKWVSIKAESEVTKQITILSILEDVPKIYKHYINDGEIDKVQLLMFELKAYHSIWRSRSNMMSVLEQLLQVADNRTMMEVIVKIFLDCPKIHEKSRKILIEVIDKFEQYTKETPAAENIALLPVVYFFRYLLMCGQESDNECVPVNNFKLNGSFTKHLQTALTELEALVNNGFTEDQFQIIDVDTFYNVAKNIALEFESHGLDEYCYKAFLCASKVAEHSGKKFYVLECCGYLSKFAGEKDVDVEIDENVAGYKYLVQYHINLTYNYLSYLDYLQASNHFKSATNYLSQSEQLNDSTFYLVSLKFLKFKLIELATHRRQAIKDKLCLEPLTEGYSMMKEKMIQGNVFHPDHVTLLLQILETIIYYFFKLKSTKNFTQYCKDGLSLAKTFYKPLYTSKFLIYSVYCDFQQNHINEAQAEIVKIHDILMLNIENGDLEPPFLSHDECKCYQCNTSDYLHLVLSAYHLQGIKLIYENDETSVEYFQNTLTLYSKLRRKLFNMYITNPRISSSKTTSYIKWKEDRLLDCYFKCHIDFINCLDVRGDNEKAIKMSQSLITLLQPIQFSYQHHYVEAVLQFITLKGIVNDLNAKPVNPLTTETFKTSHKNKSKNKLHISNLDIIQPFNWDPDNKIVIKETPLKDLSTPVSKPKRTTSASTIKIRKCSNVLSTKSCQKPISISNIGMKLQLEEPSEAAKTKCLTRKKLFDIKDPLIEPPKGYQTRNRKNKEN